MKLILASASPRRLDLLARIGVTPDAVDPAHIDESIPPGELPRDHALRLAIEKAKAAFGPAPSRVDRRGARHSRPADAQPVGRDDDCDQAAE
jgi:septum formation protein